MRYNEKAFFELINMGVFKVYKNGKIYTCKRKIRFEDEYKDCKPKLKNGMCSGYIRISFKYNGKITHIFAHRAIWLYFNGEIPEGLEPNHKSGVKFNNRLSNLELVTRSENQLHAYRIGLAKGKCGDSSTHHVLTEKKVLKIKKLLKEGIFQYVIAKMFNVNGKTISRISTGETWSHVT